MKLHSIRGGTIEDLENKKCNIGVGISLGNKWFNVENIVALVEWCLEYTRDNVVIYVADSIHNLNIQARSGWNAEKSLAKALEMGESIMREVKSEIDKTFTDIKKDRIEYVHWNEIIDEEYKTKLEFLYKYYESNPDFKNAITGMVKNHINGEARSFSDESIELMSKYILEELPECISRVKTGAVKCDAYAYPADGFLPEFIEKIQKGEIFSEVKDVILDTEPKVFLEVR